MNTWKTALKVLVAVAMLLMFVAPLEAQNRRGNLVIVGEGLNQSYNVTGKIVTVRGDNNRITWSGHTPLLRVSGSNNRVYADAARAIIIYGRNNTVYWKRRYNGKSPRVSRTGSDNWVMSNKKAKP